MASFEDSIGTPSGYFNLKVEYSYTQSTSGNYSDVSATGYVKRNRSTVYPYNSSSSASLSINGSSVGYSGAYNLGSDGYKAIVSHSVRVYHDNNGNATIPISFSFNGLLSNYYPNGATSRSITLANIPRKANMTSASNFNDEENPSFKFSNPANASMSCWLEPKPTGEHLAIRTLSGTSGTYTWSLTEAERNQLRNKCTTSNSCVCRIGLYSTISGTTYASYKDVTMTIVNANPVFENFDFEDINATTVALTGNNQKIIKNYSTVKATIPTNFIATSQKGATMSKYSLKINEDQRDITYSASESTFNSIDCVKSGVFDVYAIDSRNNSTLVTKNATEVIIYNPLIKGDISVSRSNGTSEQTTLTLSGEVDLIDFGIVTNSIKYAKYRYKQTDSNTWSNYTNITLSIDNNGHFTYNDFILGDTNNGFDIENSYNIEVYIEDELTNITYTYNLGSGIPNIALHKQGVSIMGKYNTTNGGLFQIAGEDVSLLGTTYSYHLTRNTTTLSANGWRAMANDYTTGDIPAGKYLVIVSATVTGTSSLGLITINPYIDSDRTNLSTRQTIPIVQTLLCSCVTTFFYEFEYDGTHTINIYGYSNQNFTVNDNNDNLMFTFIRIRG